MWPWRGMMSAEDSSRPEEDSDKARLLELVFAQLMHEVQHGAPGARLSARLRTALERMSPAERRALVSRAADGSAPLFVAARRGNAEVAEYLVHVCGAPLEQCGAYCTPAERATHRVTPLWAAAVGGRLAALRVLADAGAELDARSDSGSTPLRSACFMTHLAAVRFLCERGADVHKTNHNGGTCLINGVQCARLTAYLLARGASVDARDAHGKTALHYAIQEHRVDTARVLLAAGASPHVRSAAGDDALRTACVRGAHQVVELLCSSVRYSPEQIADAHELLGATQLDEFNDAAAALGSWRRATAIRHSGEEPIPKRPAVGECAALGGAREWSSPQELEELAADAEGVRVQAVLVAVRVLGERHKDTVFRLMYRGAWYADAGRLQRCVELWTWALQIRIATDTLLHTDTCHTVCALTRLLVDLCLADEQGGGGGAPHEVVMRVLRLVARAVPESQVLVSVRPWCAAQAEAWDRTLRCLVHLAALADRGAGSSSERALLVDEMRTLAEAWDRTLRCLVHLAALADRGAGSSSERALLVDEMRTLAEAWDRTLRCLVHLAALADRGAGSSSERALLVDEMRTLAEAWDRTLRCLVHLAALADRGAGSSSERALLVDEMRTLVSCAPSTHSARESLLHLVCSRLTSVRSAYFAEETRPPALFPSPRAARLLLAAGAAGGARDALGRTALHVAAVSYNYSAELVEVLVAGGAHACSPDARGAAPLDLLPAARRDSLLRHVTLACLAARALLRHPARAPPAHLLPRTLRPFLDLHRC